MNFKKRASLWLAAALLAAPVFAGAVAQPHANASHVAPQVRRYMNGRHDNVYYQYRNLRTRLGGMPKVLWKRGRVIGIAESRRPALRRHHQSYYYDHNVRGTHRIVALFINGRDFTGRSKRHVNPADLRDYRISYVAPKRQARPVRRARRVSHPASHASDNFAAILDECLLGNKQGSNAANRNAQENTQPAPVQRENVANNAPQRTTPSRQTAVTVTPVNDQETEPALPNQFSNSMPINDISVSQLMSSKPSVNQNRGNVNRRVNRPVIRPVVAPVNRRPVLNPVARPVVNPRPVINRQPVRPSVVPAPQMRNNVTPAPQNNVAPAPQAKPSNPAPAAKPSGNVYWDANGYPTREALREAVSYLANDINQDRASVGVKPLKLADYMNNLASQRADQTFTDGFTHYEPNGSMYMTDDAQRDGYSLGTNWGENLATTSGYRDQTPSQIAGTMDKMLFADEKGATPAQDGGHRKNIRNPKFTRMGVAFKADGNGTTNAVENFDNN